MKICRILPLLALFATTSLFAVEVARVTSLTGTAHRTIGEVRPELKVLDSLEYNEVVEVKADSILGLKYTRGETFYFEGPARFRIHAPKDDSAPMVIDLLFGKLSGNAGQGMTDIRTAAGVASLGKGNLGAFEYTTSLTSGTLVVYAIEGDLPVISDGLNVVVPAGKMGVFGVNVSDETVSIPPFTYTQIRSHAAGNFGTPVAVAPTAPKPDLALINLNGRLEVLSPNGEGNLD